MIGDETRALIDTLRQGQRKWIGHRLREVLLLRTAIQLKMDRTKKETIHCLCYFTIILILFHCMHRLAVLYYFLNEKN